MVDIWARLAQGAGLVAMTDLEKELEPYEQSTRAFWAAMAP
jgi:hypothetical protein